MTAALSVPDKTFPFGLGTATRPRNSQRMGTLRWRDEQAHEPPLHSQVVVVYGRSRSVYLSPKKPCDRNPKISSRTKVKCQKSSIVSCLHRGGRRVGKSKRKRRMVMHDLNRLIMINNFDSKFLSIHPCPDTTRDSDDKFCLIESDESPQSQTALNRTEMIITFIAPTCNNLHKSRVAPEHNHLCSGRCPARS